MRGGSGSARYAGPWLALVCACSFNTSGTQQTGPSLASDSATTASSGEEDTESGVDETSTNGDSLAGDPSTGDDLSCGGTCVEAAGGAWLGPVYVATGAQETPPSCPAGVDVLRTAFSSLTASEAECECSCDGGLGSCRADYELFGGSSCSLVLDSGSLEHGQCRDHGTLLSTMYVRASLEATAGECSPSASASVPPAKWGESSVLCSAGEPSGGCGGEVCVVPPPNDFDAALCIFADGDVPCPRGAYSQRRLMFDGLNDDRACTECVCSVSAPPVCSGSIYGNAQPGCNGQETALSFDNCEAYQVGDGTYALSATLAPTTPTQCSSSGSLPVGQAAPTGAFTVCCAP